MSSGSTSSDKPAGTADDAGVPEAESPKTGASEEPAEQLGVLASWKATPNASRFVLLGVFINQFGAFLQLFMVLYMTHRGFTETQGGYALGAYGAGAVVGLLFGGGLSDRLGPRLTIAISMGSSAAMLFAISLLSWYPAILVAVAVAGLMTQANRPASAALLAELTPPSRLTMVMAMNRFALNTGLMAGPMVAAWLITISWNLLLWMDGLTALAYSLIAIFLLPRRKPAAGGDGAAATGGTGVGYLMMFRDSRFVLFLVAFFTNALVHVQYYAILPLWLEDNNYPTVVYSTMFLISGGMVITLEMWFTARFTQKWPSWLPGSLGLLILSLGLAMFALPGGLVMIWVARVMGIAGQIVGAPAIFAWPARVAPEGAAGRYLGAGMSTFWAGYALGPVLGVLLYEQIGEVSWWLVGVVGVISAIAAAFAMRSPVRSNPGFTTTAPQDAPSRA